MPFSKLELAIEFNPAEAQLTRKPISVLIFPDKRIKQIAKFEQGASLKVGENFELEVATPELDLKAGTAKAEGKAGVDLGASGGFNLALGPFAYDLKKLELEHTDLGNSKVFWKVFTAKYLHTERPQFIVVFQVPRQVKSSKSSPPCRLTTSSMPARQAWARCSRFSGKRSPISSARAPRSRIPSSGS